MQFQYYLNYAQRKWIVIFIASFQTRRCRVMKCRRCWLQKTRDDLHVGLSWTKRKRNSFCTCAATASSDRLWNSRIMTGLSFLLHYCLIRYIGIIGNWRVGAWQPQNSTMRRTRRSQGPIKRIHFCICIYNLNVLGGSNINSAGRGSTN